MTKDEALSGFEDWYNACLEAGIEPEEIVSEVGGMRLITDEETITMFEEFIGQ